MFKYKYEYKYFKTVLEYKYQVYASEVTTISTTNCRRLKICSQ